MKIQLTPKGTFIKVLQARERKELIHGYIGNFLTVFILSIIVLFSSYKDGHIIPVDTGSCCVAQAALDCSTPRPSASRLLQLEVSTTASDPLAKFNVKIWTVFILCLISVCSPKEILKRMAREIKLASCILDVACDVRTCLLIVPSIAFLKRFILVIHERSYNENSSVFQNGT